MDLGHSIKIDQTEVRFWALVMNELNARTECFFKSW